MFTDIGAGGNGTCRSLRRYEHLKQVGCPGHFNIALYLFWLHVIKASSDSSLSFRNSPMLALYNLELSCFPSDMCMYLLLPKWRLLWLQTCGSLLRSAEIHIFLNWKFWHFYCPLKRILILSMRKVCRHCSYVMPSIVGIHYSFQSYGISFYSLTILLILKVLLCLVYKKKNNSE